jgi:short subunit fatty acids transporter
MLVFGVDVPLVEVVFTLAIIILILLIESLVVIMLLLKQMGKTKKVGEAVEKLSEAILQVKRAEIEELDKLSRR